MTTIAGTVDAFPEKVAVLIWLSQILALILYTIGNGTCMDECSRVEFSARVLQGCKQSVAPRRGHGLDAARTKAMISVCGRAEATYFRFQLQKSEMKHEMVKGQWSKVNVQWSMFNGQSCD